MKLQTFNGGESSLLLPQFINANEGVVYKNINSDKGALVPEMLPLQTAIKVKPYHYWFKAGKRWIDSDVRRDYVEFESNLYWTDRIHQPQKLSKDGIQTNLGITPPAKITDAVVSLAVQPVTTAKILPQNFATGLPVKDYNYLLINNDASGYSNALQFLVNSRLKVTTIAQATASPAIRPIIDSTSSATTFMRVTVSDITGVTAGSVGFQLYRQYNGVFRLVGLVSPSLVDSVEDISANAALDETLFSPLDGVYQYVMTYYNTNNGDESGPSPVSEEFSVKDSGFITLNNLSVSSDVQVTKKRIYRVGGNIGEFTLITTIDNSVTTFIDKVKDVDAQSTLLSTSLASPAPSQLKYLQEAYAMLFGALGATLRFTPVGKPDEWPEIYYLQFDADITGIAPVANGILVFTEFRTFIVTGNGPDSLSQYLLSSDQGCVAFESVQLIATEAVWVSHDGICSSSGNRPVVITKVKLGKININPIDSVIYDETYYVMEANGDMLVYQAGLIKRFNFNVYSLEVANNKLYGYRDGLLYSFYDSEEPSVMEFMSARFTEGAFTTNKNYKKIFIYSRGQVIINILINNIIVQTKELTGEDSFTIQVPQELQRGFYIQFDVKGTGEVYEINFDIGAAASG